VRDSRLKTLVLYADYITRLSYFDDWLDALAQAPGFATSALNICDRGTHPAIRQALREVDLTILLHSTNGDTTAYLEPILPLLQDRRGRLLSFVGNEVNLPGSPIAAKRNAFARMRPDFIATQLPLEAGEVLWGDLARVVALPHALNPDAFRPEVPHARRTLDIGVRAVQYLPHLGDEERNRLHGFFATHRFDPPLKVEVSDARLDRRGWAAYLNDARGTVSTEAGAWYLERDDHTVKAIRRWTAATYGGGRLVIANDSPLRTLGHKLPWALRWALRRLLSIGPVRHEATMTEQIPFAEVHARFFRDYPKPAFYGKCISSRHFDAVGTKTCQIMFPGRFNGILNADEHYIALQPDFANLDEAMARFRDPAERQAVVDRAYDHVMAAHTYRHRVAELHAAVTASGRPATPDRAA